MKFQFLTLAAALALGVVACIADGSDLRYEQDHGVFVAAQGTLSGSGSAPPPPGPSGSGSDCGSPQSPCPPRPPTSAGGSTRVPVCIPDIDPGCVHEPPDVGDDCCVEPPGGSGGSDEGSGGQPRC